jgi:large subunit ribosomal protein L24
MYIRKDDTVVILAGDDKGKRGRVLRVLRADGKLVVEGINKVYKHLKPSRLNPQGGRLSKEMPIQISNVMLVCPSCGKASRTGARLRDDGVKERYCKKCGAGVGVLAPARKAPVNKAPAKA